jgi:HK97 gp10 family phage protein
VTVEVEVSTRGLDFEAVAETLDLKTKQLLVKRLAEIAYFEAFYGAPWKSGKLARSIILEVDDDGEAKIQALAPYAKFVVEGTRPHEIRPASASVLVFKAKNGDLVFTRLVRHPGTKPNPFLQRAVDKAQDQVDDIWAELFEDLAEELTD